EQHLTTNVNEIAASLERIKILSTVGYQGVGKILPAGAQPATGSLAYTTAIWDAIWITCKSVMSEVEPKTRRVIVIITDGEDTSSRASLDEAIAYAIQTDTIVFAIGIGDPAVSNGVNKSVLKKLSSETGGQVYFPTTDDDLNTSFKRIETELRSQYVVAYVPQQTKTSGPYRKIRIEITNPDLKRLRLFYRKNYFAGL
ncbi:MAG TPA: VWA domain-containing protein, partial [Pyrinomonadaceae bacterium]|nr:VWA domain-containing protein [Pyrinomonadaceae bacterium]